MTVRREGDKRHLMTPSEGVSMTEYTSLSSLSLSLSKCASTLRAMMKAGCRLDAGWKQNAEWRDVMMAAFLGLSAL